MGNAHILIPAAGASRRMEGRDKLLEPVDGGPLLARTVRHAMDAGAAKVWVTLPPGPGARRDALKGTFVKVIEVPDWDEGISASLRAGARAAGAQAASGLVVVLPDLPEIETADIARFVEEHRKAPDAALRATAGDGRPGHPVLIPARLFEMLAGLHGDTGARAVLEAEGDMLRALPLAGARAVTDLDTPADWAAWRAATGR